MRSPTAESCVCNWPVTAASCAAQAAIASEVWVCESSTGPARSISATSGSRFARASIASSAEPLISRESSSPNPATAVYDSSMTVCRFS
ncbi:Uncharacterised protein [Mycobacterium tuberculosis]|nr:Uncharacterised protein [Mycobacterium tuberculosis]CKS26019.1 Uncharacterised protein [Mycobacterium tuberculosis]CNU89400.1 Uncharacterised protein [Mycobacterium tuberculosis]CNV26141.1 Uncharacterised protein [Mycobacterium tuberculosis]CNV29265.1 Uncharacterised protein [Mycobacterium tuberculosis]